MCIRSPIKIIIKHLIRHFLLNVIYFVTYICGLYDVREIKNDVLYSSQNRCWASKVL